MSEQTSVVDSRYRAETFKKATIHIACSLAEKGVQGR